MPSAENQKPLSVLRQSTYVLINMLILLACHLSLKDEIK